MEHYSATWVLGEDGEPELKLSRWQDPLLPLRPTVYPCDTFSFPITNLKLTFWERRGLNAVRTVYGSRPYMSSICFWWALSDLEKRRLLHRARQIRTWIKLARDTDDDREQDDE